MILLIAVIIVVGAFWLAASDEISNQKRRNRERQVRRELSMRGGPDKPAPRLWQPSNDVEVYHGQ